MRAYPFNAEGSPCGHNPVLFVQTVYLINLLKHLSAGKIIQNAQTINKQLIQIN